MRMQLPSALLLCSRCRLLPSCRVPSRSYQWQGETHYSVLGVTPEATPREIKLAYLALSKELHPDLNQGQDDKTAFRTHQKYVRVNQAYSVVGNRKDRQVYDTQLLGLRMSKETVTDQAGNQRTVYRPMTFEQRSQAMGFKPQVRVLSGLLITYLAGPKLLQKTRQLPPQNCGWLCCIYHMRHSSTGVLHHAALRPAQRHLGCCHCQELHDPDGVESQR